jgi:hypothetical protein
MCHRRSHQQMGAVVDVEPVDNSVPHIRTNELPEHTIRDNWLVVAGMREVVAEQCNPTNFPVCPRTGKGVFCRNHHAKLIPPAKGNYRVYEVAELAPSGGLVALNAGRRRGTVLVTPEHRDLWTELASAPTQRPEPMDDQQIPHHRPTLRFGFGHVIDHQCQQAPQPIDHCVVCRQPMTIYEPDQTTHPLCDPSSS